MKIPLSRRRLILLLLLLVVILGLGVLLRDFVRLNIVDPMVNLGWLVWVTMLTVPQIVFWAIFLLLAVSVAGRSLSSGPRRILGSAGPPIAAHPYSRYHHWQVGLEALPNSPFSRERMERELQALVLQVLAEQQRTDYENLRARQMHGELDLSGEGPAIQTLFLHDGRMGYPEQAPLLRRLWARLLGRPLPQLEGLPPLDVDGIITWLEIQTGSGKSQET
jgi:hypothetical protein